MHNDSLPYRRLLLLIINLIKPMNTTNKQKTDYSKILFIILIISLSVQVFISMSFFILTLSLGLIIFMGKYRIFGIILFLIVYTIILGRLVTGKLYVMNGSNGNSNTSGNTESQEEKKPMRNEEVVKISRSPEKEESSNNHTTNEESGSLHDTNEDPNSNVNPNNHTLENKEEQDSDSEFIRNLFTNDSPSTADGAILQRIGTETKSDQKVKEDTNQRPDNNEDALPFSQQNDELMDRAKKENNSGEGVIFTSPGIKADMTNEHKAAGVGFPNPQDSNKHSETPKKEIRTDTGENELKKEPEVPIPSNLERNVDDNKKSGDNVKNGGDADKSEDTDNRKSGDANKSEGDADNWKSGDANNRKSGDTDKNDEQTHPKKAPEESTTTNQNKEDIRNSNEHTSSQSPDDQNKTINLLNQNTEQEDSESEDFLENEIKAGEQESVLSDEKSKKKENSVTTKIVIELQNGQINSVQSDAGEDIKVNATVVPVIH